MSADVQFFCSATSEDQKKTSRPQNDVQFSAQKQGRNKKKSSGPHNDVHFSAQKQVKTKKKVITSAGRNLLCDFPKFFAVE